MQGFEWAENDLGVETPDRLQQRGVNVFFAPEVSPGTRIVNLANGSVEWLQPGETRPPRGYYASYDDLERYCRQRGLPFTEIEGIVSIQPVGFDEAGDPLQHRGP